MAVVTCHTEDCGNNGVGIPLALMAEDDDGNPIPVNAVVCGACGQEITDVANDERTEAQ